MRGRRSVRRSHPQPRAQRRQVGDELRLRGVARVPGEVGEEGLQPLAPGGRLRGLARHLEAERRELRVEPGLPMAGHERPQGLLHLGQRLARAAALPFRAPPRHGASDVEPLLHRRQGGPRDRRLARHRAHDRARLRRGRREGLHLRAQGRGVRPGRGRALAAGHVRPAARRLLDRGGRARPGRRARPPRGGAPRLGQERRRQLGRAARRVPRRGVGQGARLEREGRLPPDARLPAAPRASGAARRPGARHQHRLDRRPPRARPRVLRLLREQGGGAPPDARTRAPAGGAEHHRERDRARPLREKDDARDARALPRRDRRLLSARAHRRARRHGGRGDLPRLACRRVPDRRRHPGGRGHPHAARVMASTVEAAGRLPEPLGLAERAKRAFFRSFFRLLLGFIALAEWASAAWVLFVAGVHVPRAAHLLAPLAIYALNRWIITRPRHARLVTGTLSRVYVPVAFSSIFLALFLALAGGLWGVGTLLAGPHLAHAYYWLVNAGFATVAGLLFYGYTFGRRRLAVSHLEVPVRGLPSTLDGLRLVHLSDLHIGAHLDLAELGEHVERVNALAPDLICVTGDLVDRPETCAEAFPTLAGLRARHGVFVTLGNHDFYAGADTVTAALRRLTPFRVLRDERVEVAIGGALPTLLRIDDLRRDWARGVLEHPALPPLAAGVTTGRPFIVLSHRPDCFPQAARLGAALMLSGHTHGGQLALPWPGRRTPNPAEFISAFDRGLYRDGDATVYVNRGLGFTGQKIRLFTPREIACLTLRAR